jgi:hypothetical protein
MTAHTLDGLMSLIRNLSVYRSDKTVAQQKEEACTYAAALAGQAPKVPEGFALVPVTEDEIAQIAERMEASDPTDTFWRHFARQIEHAFAAKNGPLSAEPANKEQTE